jgi:hypothetical protein
MPWFVSISLFLFTSITLAHSRRVNKCSTVSLAFRQFSLQDICSAFYYTPFAGIECQINDDGDSLTSWLGAGTGLRLNTINHIKSKS